MKISVKAAAFHPWDRLFLMFFACLTIAAAQPSGSSPFTCSAQPGTPVIVRVEGITELVGDLLLQCIGGTPTRKDEPIPRYNITVILNTDITSRVLPTGASEALLLIDEPSPENLNLCDPTKTPYQCLALGTGTGVKVYGLSPLAPNAYEGSRQGSGNANSVTWLGVPFDAPGASGDRHIRITNVRADAAQLAVAANLVGRQITMSISITDDTSQLIFNANQIVGYVNGAPGTNVFNGGFFDFTTPIISSARADQPKPPPSTSTALPDFVLQIIAAVEGAFRIRAPPGSTSTSADRTESGTSDQAILGKAGQADYPTMVETDFGFVDLNGNATIANFSVFAPQQVSLTPSGHLDLKMDTNVMPVPGTGLAAISGAAGFAAVVYQTTEADPTTIQSAKIPLWFSWPASLPTGTFIAFPTLSPYVQGGIADGKAFPEFSVGDDVRAAVGVYNPSAPAKLTIIGGAPSIDLKRDDGTPIPARYQIVATSAGGPEVPIKVDAVTTTPHIRPRDTATAPKGSLVPASWLEVRTTANHTPATVTIILYPQGLPANTYSGTVHVTATDGSGQVLTIPVTMTIAGNPPKLSADGVVSAATGKSGAISPGELLVLYGDRFGPDSLVYSMVLSPPPQLYTQTANTRVFFNGTPAPMVYVTKNQMAAVAPYEIAGQTDVEIIVEYNGNWSVPIHIPVTDAAPGLFTANSSGGGPAAALNQDGSANSSKNPVARDSFLILYSTGEGVTNPAGVSGKLGDANQTHPILPVTVNIGGLDVIPDYAGSAVGLVQGVMQINVRVPKGVTPDNAVPIKVRIGDQASPNGVTVAVK